MILSLPLDLIPNLVLTMSFEFVNSTIPGWHQHQLHLPRGWPHQRPRLPSRPHDAPLAQSGEVGGNIRSSGRPDPGHHRMAHSHKGESNGANQVKGTEAGIEWKHLAPHRFKNGM